MALFSAALYAIGCKHPSEIATKKIKHDSIRNQLSKWYAGRRWVCVEVIDNYPGFMGMPTRVVILESDKERVRLTWHRLNIVKGTHVILRLRTDDEMKNGFWISAADEVMTPDTQPA